MPSNIVAPRVPLTDPRTGLISREWYNFFLTLFNLTGAGQSVTSITDLQGGPPPVDVGEVAVLVEAIQGLQEAPPSPDTSELVKGLQGLQEAPPVAGLTEQIVELTKTVQGLQEAPPAVGVTSFNDRQGEVKLASLDVTKALTFTPANIAGDTFTGPVRAISAASQAEIGQAADQGFILGHAAGFHLTYGAKFTGAGWEARQVDGGLLVVRPKSVTYSLFAGATVGGTPTFESVVTFDAAGLTMATGRKMIGAAPTASVASLNLPHGSAPTTPANGDVWTTTAGVFVHINGVTKQLATL